MANFVCNVAKGKVAEKVADGATIKMLILKTSGTDDAMKDADTLAALIALGSEADFTNYSRKTLSNLAVTVDDSGNRVLVDNTADITFAAAGGASNNTTTDAVIYEEIGGGDANCIPLVVLDAVFTTDGNDVTLAFHADGFFQAGE